MLREGDLDRLLPERLFNAVCIEEELDHLPVPFMQVVEVIEVIEEPILQRDTGLPVCGGNRGVDHGLPIPHHRFEVRFIVAAGSTRFAGEVSREFVGEGEEVGILDRAGHRLLLRPLTQDNVVIGEDHVDGRWQVRLSICVAGEILALQDDDWGKPGRKLLLWCHALPGKGSSTSGEQRHQAESERRGEAAG